MSTFLDTVLEFASRAPSWCTVPALDGCTRYKEGWDCKESTKTSSDEVCSRDLSEFDQLSHLHRDRGQHLHFLFLLVTTQQVHSKKKKKQSHSSGQNLSLPYGCGRSHLSWSLGQGTLGSTLGSSREKGRLEGGRV